MDEPKPTAHELVTELVTATLEHTAEYCRACGEKEQRENLKALYLQAGKYAAMAKTLILHAESLK